jgi:hypothetical protein
MNTAAAHPVPAMTRAEPEARPTDAQWPTNLKLLLFVLGAFAVNITAVLYLAAQMPH